MYKELELDFVGFWREPAISGLPSKSGIYCVYTCTHNKEEKTVSVKNVVYIGESADVRDRIDGHEKWDTWKKQCKQGEVICISCALIASSDRNRGEAAMIYKHKPILNMEYMNSFPYDKTKIITTGKNKGLSSSFVVDRDD